MEKSTSRIYLSLTNKCNRECDFCAMYSSPSKNTFLSFDKYKNIIDQIDGYFELQLEGGEPFLSDDFYLFLEYARATKKCNKIIISTNGVLLKYHLQRLTDFVKFSKIEILIKRSINDYLYKKNLNIFKECRDLYLATEFIDNFSITFNVRLKHGDNEIINLLEKYKLFDFSDIYYLQNYGRMDDEEYDKPFINKNINNFYLYSSDGICFYQDLIGRSEYEKTLK